MEDGRTAAAGASWTFTAEKVTPGDGRPSSDVQRTLPVSGALPVVGQLRTTRQRPPAPLFTGFAEWRMFGHAAPFPMDAPRLGYLSGFVGLRSGPDLGQPTPFRDTSWARVQPVLNCFYRRSGIPYEAPERESSLDGSYGTPDQLTHADLRRSRLGFSS